MPALIFFTACNNPQTPGKPHTDSVAVTSKDSVVPNAAGSSAALPKLGIYTLRGDSLLVPPFEVEVTLSPKASERISKTNETIVVDVLLQGTPRKGIKAHLEEDGSFYVGSASREIRPGQVARIDNLSFSKKIYDQLEDKDVDVNINVYTGRHSSPDNLITGDMLDGKISTLINKHFKLAHKLIYGDN